MFLACLRVLTHIINLNQLEFPNKSTITFVIEFSLFTLIRKKSNIKWNVQRASSELQTHVHLEHALGLSLTAGAPTPNLHCLFLSLPQPHTTHPDRQADRSLFICTFPSLCCLPPTSMQYLLDVTSSHCDHKRKSSITMCVSKYMERPEHRAYKDSYGILYLLNKQKDRWR